tara:strand:+ start:1223 stop:1423 length:201 start_codon:yes stop_codon:yes gene_type:complete
MFFDVSVPIIKIVRPNIFYLNLDFMSPSVSQAVINWRKFPFFEVKLRVKKITIPGLCRILGNFVPI